jgi:hypothetical protein
VPRAGRDFNAFYDRNSINFYYDLHPVTRKIVFSADSTEAVDHELGHAILDALHPELWDKNDAESNAFKEAFGDITSMISSLHRPQVVSYALNETGGDLRKSNVISRIADELGNAIHYREPNNGRSPNSLRDAVDVFHYQNPNTLPTKSPYTALSQESHNFCRVFTGAWYDLFVSMVEATQNCSVTDAISQTRERLSKLTLHSLNGLCLSRPLFLSMGQAMMRTDIDLNLGCKSFVRSVFTRRGILPPEVLY